MIHQPEQPPISIPGTKIHPESSATFMQRFADLRDRFLSLFAADNGHVKTENRHHPVQIRVYSGAGLDEHQDIAVHRTLEEMMPTHEGTGRLGKTETLERRHDF